MNNGRFILLDGASSSGKTSIIKEFQKISMMPYLHFGIDLFLSAIPSPYMPDGEFCDQGFKYIYEQRKLIRIEMNKMYRRWLRSYYCAIRTMLSNGVHIISDEVLSKPKVSFLNIVFCDYSITKIHITCNEAEISRREIARTDRPVGIGRLHLEKNVNIIEHEYSIDTSKMPPSSCARQLNDYLILKFHDTITN